jgi:molybdate transport system ATP-binding protein
MNKTGNAGTRLHVDIEKQWPGFRLSVQLEAGAEIMVLFGPSGAGKSSTLSAIAGLVMPDAGEISLDGRVLFRRIAHATCDADVKPPFGMAPVGEKRPPGLEALAGLWGSDRNRLKPLIQSYRTFFGADREAATVHVPARDRRIGFVFQNYALFPHLTALENVAYPLQVGRYPWSRRADNGRAAALLERMRLAHLAGRYPHELSGGQQQRVAIARALAADPQALLLDEPFSALDSATRERLQRDLRDLQAELGLAVVYVTHRLEDAFALGHRLAIIRDGQVAQAGPIAEVFRRPADYHVAEIMGIRNLFRAKVIGVGPGHTLLDWGGLHLEAPPLPMNAESDEGVGADEAITAYIQPEDIKVLYPDRPVMGAVAHNRVAGRITESREGAGYRLLRVALPNGHEVEVRFSTFTYVPLSLLAGDTIQLSLRKEGLILLPPQVVSDQL